MTVRPKLLITRPAEEQARTAAAAWGAGFDPVATPLLQTEPVPFDLPEELPPALLFTSARTPALAAAAHPRLRSVPAYAVGAHCASAASAAGFAVRQSGDSDGSAIVALAYAAGERHLLHLGGEQRAAYRVPAGMCIEHRVVYRMAACESLTAAAVAALRDGALALLMSPRTATNFAAACQRARLDRQPVAIVVISEAAAQAAGAGWQEIAVAEQPSLAACLAAARQLWQRGRNA